MEKYILLKKLGNQKKGSSILIHEFQKEHFIEKGLIEGKIKKTKTKKVVEEQLDTEIEIK
tara:strand:+ start:3029 stop:3208 length:180 start_codon:yes stop_codon:yes gene_type:complete